MRPSLTRLWAVAGLLAAAPAAFGQADLPPPLPAPLPAVGHVDAGPAGCPAGHCADGHPMFVPTMFGDAPGPLFTSGDRFPPFNFTGGRSLLTQVARGSYKIAENESPRPLDRVYATFNYFNNVAGSFKRVPGIVPVQRAPANPPPTAPGAGGGPFAPPFFVDLSPFRPRSIDVYREVLGVEKTFMDGNASVGARLPFIQSTGTESFDTGIGDLSLVFKYAFLNEDQRVLSAGVVVTVPTGAELVPDGFPSPHETLVQPFVGGIMFLNDCLYVHGFSSVVIPTDSDDVTFGLADLGVGYYLLRDARPTAPIRYIVPTFELHLTTALNNDGAETQPLGGVDVLNFTYGVTFGVKKGDVKIGLAHPVTGPTPFDVEFQLYINRFF